MLTVERQEAPALEEGEWWAHELEGCEVVDGEWRVGTVSRMIELPSCEALEVRREMIGSQPTGSHPPAPLMVPMVKDAIRRMASPMRRIEVDMSFLGEAEEDVETMALEAGGGDARARGADARKPAQADSGRDQRGDRHVHAVSRSGLTGLPTQRHVRNALAAGTSFHCVNFREHTQLSGGQVDDTPFGGGAGMVLRVDVVDSALRAHYGIDPVRLGEQRRVIALTPGGRLLDDGLVDELAAEPALTLVVRTV